VNVLKENMMMDMFVNHVIIVVEHVKGIQKTVSPVQLSELTMSHLVLVLKDNSKLLDGVKIVTINVNLVPLPLPFVISVLISENKNQSVTVQKDIGNKKTTQFV
jgi:SPX domain protein involved in polyphosphate accumulation